MTMPPHGIDEGTLIALVEYPTLPYPIPEEAHSSLILHISSDYHYDGCRYSGTLIVIKGPPNSDNLGVWPL